MMWIREFAIGLVRFYMCKSIRWPDSLLESSRRANNLTCHPRGVLTCQEGDEAGRVFWLPHATCGEAWQQVLSDFFTHPSSIGGAGINGVYCHASRRNFGCQRDGESLDSSFRGDIRQFPWHRAASLSGGQIDDAPARRQRETARKFDAQ